MKTQNEKQTEQSMQKLCKIINHMVQNMGTALHKEKNTKNKYLKYNGGEFSIINIGQKHRHMFKQLREPQENNINTNKHTHIWTHNQITKKQKSS